MANTTTFSKTLKGDVFIIPNNSAKMNGEKISSYNLDFWNSIYEQFNLIKWKNKEKMENTDFDDEEFVELWFVNDASENWFDHSIKIDDQDEDCWRPITKWFPKTIFLGNKEGDEISFMMLFEKRAENGDLIRRKVPVSLTLSQTKYRYRNKGNFEDVLKLV